MPIRAANATLIVLMMLFAVISVAMPGSGNMADWLQWIGHIEHRGLIDGYAAWVADPASGVPYPPLAGILLLATPWLHDQLDTSMFLALKWSLAASVCATSLVFFLWTRNLGLAVLFYLTLLLVSVPLGNLDVWFAFPFILALWALTKGRLWWFTVLFVTSCLIKWQPLIIAPFLLVFGIRACTSGAWSVRARSILRAVVLPALLVLIPAFLLFGPPMLTALDIALNKSSRSGGNALNFNWIVIQFLNVPERNRWDAATQGLANFGHATAFTKGIGTALFVVFYGLTLALFARREKALENLCLFTLLGYSAYFIFSPGAHDNHFLVIAILALLLYSINRRYLIAMLFAVLAVNANLILFYDGVQPIPRLAGVDLSLLLATINVLWFLVMWTTTWVPLLSREEPSAVAAAESGA
jgi:hypothetical protein